VTADPYIEVIVPAYNEEENIEACLDSVLAQEAHRPFGVLVVDDGSTDRTPAILEEYEANHGSLRVVTKSENRGYGDTIQRGFEEAIADVVCFVDGDSVMEAGSLATIIADYEAGAGAVFGYVDVKNDHRLHGLYCKVGKRHNPDARYGGALMSFRREVLADLGGFLNVENRGGHDVEIKARLRKSDYEVVFEDDAKVYSRFPEGWKNVLRQKFRAGKTHVIYSSEHPDLFDDRVLLAAAYYGVLLGCVLVPPALSVLGILLVPFLIEHGPRAWAMYRESNHKRTIPLYLVYALLGGIMRSYGVVSEWQHLAPLLISRYRSRWLLTDRQ